MSNERNGNAGAEYVVIIAPAANDRMFDHYEFLARVSEAAARKLLSRLLKDIRSLGFMPYRNPVFNCPYLKSSKYRYMISCDRYRIVYQIENDTVFVDDIQDCRNTLAQCKSYAQLTL